MADIQSSPASEPAASQPPIDRKALVSRHDIDLIHLYVEIPLGNGNFAFNADGTGLETFGGNTMSHWCWHSFPLPLGTSEEEIKPWAALEKGRLRGRTTPPPLLKDWLYLNPHPLNLGRLGFVDAQGRQLEPADCVPTGRRLTLWTGLLTSHFTYKGIDVTVKTCVAPGEDRVAVRVTSSLLRHGQLRLRLDFPSPSAPDSTDPRSGPKPWAGDFSNPANHRTEIMSHGQNRWVLRRSVHATDYWVEVTGQNLERRIQWSASSSNQLEIDSSGEDCVELTCLFTAHKSENAVSSGFAETKAACEKGWPEFWRSGGAIDLSGSRDERWKELERRIVLSQYQLAVQSAGDNFPAEVGLTGYDFWSGKFHLEMTWWHLAHYALWDRWSLAEKALDYYPRNASLAREIAANFDYKGLMWPKSTGPTAINDGWPEEMVLMWKQPHPIFFAELDYRLRPTTETLQKWESLVFGTAEMMADYPTFDGARGIYSIDPCWAACEGPELYKDPIFELGYWRWALLTAQQWRTRLGLEREPHWDEIVRHLAPLPTQNGLYIYRADRNDTYTRRKFDHLDPVGVFAMFPSFPGLDLATAHRTLLEFAKSWDWESVWGWDFPWMAMGAARVGEPGIAIEALFNPSTKNQYDERGLCRFVDSSPYLPGNGGLLYAVALMAAGWDGAPQHHAPGFPRDGSWTVRWEGLRAAP